MTHRDDAISEADFFDDAPEGDDDEPRCIECGCCLFTDEHAFDCSIGEEDEDEYGETDSD